MTLDDYLRSKDSRYYVADRLPKGARIVVLEAYPMASDLQAGLAVSAMRTCGGIPFSDVEIPEDEIGMLYLSNVPLYPTDKLTSGLIDELEGVRLAPNAASPYLCERFAEKMRRIIECESICVVAYKLQIIMNYYRDFLEKAAPALRQRLEQRLSDGTLTIVEFPRYTKAQIHRFEKTHEAFLAAIDKARSSQ